MASRDLARLVVRLEAQTSRYVAELDRANKKLAGFEAQTKRALSAIDTAFKRVLTGAAVVSLARAVTNLADQYTQLQNSLRVTGLEGRDLEAVQARLFAAANRNGVEIGGLAQLYRRSALAARELGASQTQLLQFVDGVSAALRVQGGSSEAAAGALGQLSQALGSGIVRAEEFNSILEGAAPVAQAVAKGIDRFGGSVSKLRAAIAKGQVTSREFFDGFLRGSRDLEAQAAKSTQTVGQAFTVLRNNLVRVVGGFAQSTGLSASLAGAVTTLANSIEELARVLAVAALAAGAFSAGLAIERIAAATRAFVELFSAVATGRAVLLGSAAAEQAKAAATLAAAEADVARTSATLAATRAEQAKAVVLVESTVATDAAAVAAVTAARAEYARASAVLATTRAEAAKAVVVAGVVADEGVRLGIARTLTVLEAQQVAAKQALTAAEARLAAATTATNTAMFARAAAAKQIAALEAQAAAAQTAHAAAQVRANAAASASTGALGLALGRLAAPIRALAVLARAHPIAAIAAGVVAAIGALVVFSDRIKTSADGVVTLRDTAVATWRIIAEALTPLAQTVADVFRAILAAARATFAPIIEGAKKVAEVVNTVWKFTPAGLAIEALRELAERAFDRIQDRARRIARIRNFVPGARQRSRGTQGQPEAAGDPQALKKIQDLETALRQQVATAGQGEVATIRYRIAQGDLADEFKKAGAAADPYRAKLVQLTAQLEAVKLEDLARDLEQQVGAYELSGAALIEYRLKLGDLRHAYEDAGAAGKKLGERAKAAADALEAQQLEKTLRGIRAELAELRGDTDEAFRIRFELDNEQLRKQLRARGDVAGLASVDELERLSGAVAKFNKLEAEGGRIRDRLTEQEELIRNSQEVGALTEIAAAEKIGAARAKAAADLDAILKKQQAIAKESGNPELRRNVEQSAAALELLRGQVDLVALAIQSTFEEALEGPLVDFLTGVQSAEDAFKSFVRTIEREIAQFVARDLIKRMFGDLFKSLTSSGGGGGGFDWAGLFSNIAGIFAGASGSGPALAGSAASGAFTLGAQPVMVAAGGGTFAPGVPTLVGERGPELVVPRHADAIVPNHDLRGWMQPRPIVVTNNFNLSPMGGNVDRRTASQIAAAAGRGISEASRRNL